MAVHGETTSFESETSMALEANKVLNIESKHLTEPWSESRRFIKYLSVRSMAAKLVPARMRVMAAQLFIPGPREDLIMTSANIYCGLINNRGI